MNASKIKPGRDVIGMKVEFIHPKTGQRTIGTIDNVFENGKVQVRPRYTRFCNHLSPLALGQPTINVRFDRCEEYEGEYY